MEEVPSPLAFLCEEAHRIGMKVYAVHKINDMASFGPGRFYPLGTAPDVLPGIPQIGGSGQMAFRWLRQHPEKRAEIHPSLLETTGIRKPVGTIRLWHENRTPWSGSGIELFVSEDQCAVRALRREPRYPRFREEEKAARICPAPERRFAKEGDFACVEISGLEISQPFFCIRFTGEFGLTNTLAALLEVQDVNGETVVFTWGTLPQV